ncbi:pyridoxine 5'-phosphate synthase [Coraliomargarita akajimensis]|uniref:Pyridoxine 5'-phosphate synthase n=1 Tax=Coraliomargarita akajimensis (strain DSM 45221 / IAM 15411 / JCM 23193 / KCTC 12865 / 04OKA010-24) TaxID=583355 RepID=D5EKA3_CORAD|nr:pyridoxine 5'-phosphate synthase [Coraliomargarita akajimensis]ADE54852.1 pyridoxal phosphate biosynthetic protein PdxJ [Coraliomargarita akajimensis DSM 45221]
MSTERNKILLGVNVDHCATIRQARYREHALDHGDEVEPDCVEFALLCEQAGADGITMHLREDRRHVQDSDVQRAREHISTRLNLEMACTPEMIEYALKLKPDSVCLVPESREEVTTEGGLDVVGQQSRVAEVVSAMTEAGIITSLFIDPDAAQIEASAELKSPWIELHTGAYANAYYHEGRQAELETLIQGADLAHRLGLTVNAGHGINYVNIAEVITIPYLHELNIGHTIISRALFVGVERAVREMKLALS